MPSGNGTGACSSLPVALAWSRKGPNSSPIQNVPSGARTSDSTSKSAPVSSRSVVAPFTMGKSILWSGSRSEMKLLTSMRPGPPSALSHWGLTT